MAGRRRNRFAKLSQPEREAIEQAAARLLDAMRHAKMRLIAFNEHYTALHDLGGAIRVTLNVINDRPHDYEPPIVMPASSSGPQPQNSSQTSE